MAAHCAFGRRLSSRLPRETGFILIGLAQCFFASISTCVKASERALLLCYGSQLLGAGLLVPHSQLLQEQVDMPVWEIILIRMSATWLGCYICESCPVWVATVR